MLRSHAFAACCFREDLTSMSVLAARQRPLLSRLLEAGRQAAVPESELPRCAVDPACWALSWCRWSCLGYVLSLR